MSIEWVNPSTLAEPSGFSHAVVAAGSRLIFLAGQTAMNRSGHIVGATVAEQFELALGNLLTALRAAGGQPQHLTSLTIYALDLEAYRAQAGAIGQIWRRLVGSHYPAVAGVGVARLWDAEALVEVQGMAVLP